MMKVTKCPLTISSRLVTTTPDDSETEFPQYQDRNWIIKGLAEVNLMGRAGSNPVLLQKNGKHFGLLKLIVDLRPGKSTGDQRKKSQLFRVIINKEGSYRYMQQIRRGDRVYVLGKLLPFETSYVKEKLPPDIIVLADKLHLLQRKSGLRQSKIEIGLKQSREEEMGFKQSEEEEIGQSEEEEIGLKQSEEEEMGLKQSEEEEMGLKQSEEEKTEEL